MKIFQMKIEVPVDSFKNTSTHQSHRENILHIGYSFSKKSRTFKFETIFTAKHGTKSTTGLLQLELDFLS